MDGEKLQGEGTSRLVSHFEQLGIQATFLTILNLVSNSAVKGKVKLGKLLGDQIPNSLPR